MSDALGYAAAAQAVAAAVAASALDPADRIRLLVKLASVAEPAVAATTPIGAKKAAVQAACMNLYRRSAVIQLALATVDYQPVSSDDAGSLRNTVCGLLDAEILVAGDIGDDQTFIALRELRTAVSRDLVARGASLAATETYQGAAPVPALVLAQRLYQDADRTDELISRSNATHPAFMPTSFKVLTQ